MFQLFKQLSEKEKHVAEAEESVEATRRRIESEMARREQLKPEERLAEDLHELLCHRDPPSGIVRDGHRCNFNTYWSMADMSGPSSERAHFLEAARKIMEIWQKRAGDEESQVHLLLQTLFDYQLD